MKKVKLDNFYKIIKHDLNSINKLTSDEQFKLFEKSLKEMYEDKVEVTKAHTMKCLKLLVSKNDDFLYLPNELTVEKNNVELLFYFKRRSNKTFLVSLLIFTLLVGIFSATYSALIFLEQQDLNIDIDGDGIPDINVDKDNDKVADLNIDVNSDLIPDISIDYKGNRKPIFNIDKDGDGKPDFNTVTDATEDYESCTVNCDINGDGWPDINYDVDGDGKPDFDIDTDGDGLPDSSIDLDGDLVCDIMCDDDGDGICDRNCIEFDEDEDENKPSGPSDVTGNQDNNINSGHLSVVYEDFGELLIEGLIPDDHNVGVVYPEKKFSVQNLSNFEVIYKLTMIVEKNTFTSQNFMYKIESTNNGYVSDYIVAPHEDKLLDSYVTIGPNETQEYIMTFKLHGTGEEQNYDQGKSFEGYIKIGD